MDYTNMIMVDSKTILPSCGAPYGGELPDGEVTLKEMTAHEIKILSGAHGSGYATLNGILRRLVIDCKVSLDQLLTSDRLYLLYAIRYLAFGPEYGFSYKCSDCGLQARDTLNIAELDIKYYNDEDDWEEPFTETIEGVEYELVLPRGFVEKNAEKYVERAYRRGTDGDPYQLYLVAACIKRAGDKEFKNINKAVLHVQNLPARVFWALRDVIDDHDYGMPDTVEVTCARCGYIMDIPLPMTAEFFRPRNPRGGKR